MVKAPGLRQANADMIRVVRLAGDRPARPAASMAPWQDSPAYSLPAWPPPQPAPAGPRSAADQSRPGGYRFEPAGRRTSRQRRR
jgi:hypothetical protein